MPRIVPWRRRRVNRCGGVPIQQCSGDPLDEIKSGNWTYKCDLVDEKKQQIGFIDWGYDYETNKWLISQYPAEFKGVSPSEAIVLNYVRVDSNFKGQGGKLICSTASYLQTLGFKIMILHAVTTPERQASLFRYYEKFGFKPLDPKTSTLMITPLSNSNAIAKLCNTLSL
jgi:hypothetical protein